MGQKWGTFCGGRFIIGSNDVKMFKTSSDHGKLLSICKIAKKNIRTTMNECYTFKWQLEITEFSPILMPSSTIEFITTEDFGIGVPF